MATLEDKILGEKVHNYCSSSDDEAEDNLGAEDKASAKCKSGLQFVPENKLKDQTYVSASTANTGPKGVINDWQRFKQLEAEKREHQELEKLELIKKLSITSRADSANDGTDLQEQLDDELIELENDSFLLEYQRKRMSEMLALTGKLPKFGVPFEIQNREDFLKAVDGEQKSVTVVIHIYDSNNNACNNMNKALTDLATEYINVKFCKFKSSIAGLSMTFKVSGLPALLVYKAGQIIGNFVRLTDDLTDDFNSSDVESFLIEVGMLPDKGSVPIIADEPVSSASN